jgi:hypothetical protein
MDCAVFELNGSADPSVFSWLQDGAAVQEQLRRTLKVLWDVNVREYTAEEVRTALLRHGEVEYVVVRSGSKKQKDKKGQVSALVVMGSEAAARAALDSVNGDPQAPLLVMPLLKVRC